jgi:predicted amino acid-binding ACT domain protein
VIVVDISGATSQGTRFATLRQQLQHAADELGIHVVALHDDILSTMHAV